MQEPFLRAVLPSSLLSFVIGAAVAGAASFPPELRFRSVATERVTVHFHQGLEGMAREAAALATRVLEAHETRYGERVGRVHIVLADTDDDPNGFATPLPYPLVSVRAAAPGGGDEFGNHEGWLRLVLTHELAHIVHLDEAHGLLRAGRHVFGRAPFLFPNLLTPTWMVEGLATYEETEGTAFGRGRNPDARMVLRMAALEGDFPKEDRAVLGLDRWPGGQTSYLFGESFLRDVAERSGRNTLPDLSRVHSGRVVPFLDDFTSQRVTGSSFHARWQEWSFTSRSEFEREAARRRGEGLTASRALTTRGVRQIGPRFRPDGAWVAYTSRSLTRFPAIRLVRPDGSEDHELVRRNGGAALSWTPDGRALVYDEMEVHRLFARHSDLRVVDVASGGVRALTRGLRAREPDVSPDGRTVVFVRRMGDRSELFVIGLDGAGLRPITCSAPGTEWSGPRWRPQGDLLVASRLLPGGWLDVVTVDPASGAATPLTEDRAKDVEPTWTPEGSTVVFRSDRDGVSNLYAVGLVDRDLRRLTNVLGGAFTPSVSGDEVAFSDYSSRGYDVRVARLDLAAASPAAPFLDPYPPPSPPLPCLDAPVTPYRPFPTLLPRFWSPFFLIRDRENQYGVATAGTDPLFRHVYGMDLYRGTESGRFSAQGFYQYDRFRTTFLVTAEDTTDAEAQGLLRTRTLNLRATYPLTRTVRSSQDFSLAWRRERQTDAGASAGGADLGGIEAAWSLSTVQQYPYSISPVDGWRLRLAYLKEDPAFGSDVSLGKVTGDARYYARLGESSVLALRAGGGFTMGRPSFRRSFAVGGFPDANLLDLVRTNVAVLRGYPDNAFTGRRFVQANVEYRVPLLAPQRGFRSLPVFVRHLHGTVFFDAAHAWSGPFRLVDLKTAAGVALGVDTYLAHRLPVTGSVGLARGFATQGETSLYLRVGLAF